MKKISKATGNIQITGNAGIDSICFKAHRVNGSFSLLRNSIVAHIDEKGEISCAGKDAFTSEKKKAYETLTAVEKKYNKIFKIASIVTLAVSILIILANINLVSVVSALFLFMWSCYCCYETVGLFIEKLKRNKEILGILKFHSAEHAVINAYQDLGRVPTLNEIRDYSNYSYNCGSLTSIKKFSLMFLISIVRLLPNPKLYLLIIVVIAVAFIVISKEKFFFMQFLVTAKPTDREYKVAIEGLKYALEGLESKQAETEVSYIQKIMIFMDMMAGHHKFSEDVCKYCTNYTICKKQFDDK